MFTLLVTGTLNHSCLKKILISDINKAENHHSFIACVLFLGGGAFSLNPRDGWVRKSRQFLKYWHQQPCYIQSHLNHFCSPFSCSIWTSVGCLDYIYKPKWASCHVIGWLDSCVSWTAVPNKADGAYCRLNCYDFYVLATCLSIVLVICLHTQVKTMLNQVFLSVFYQHHLTKNVKHKYKYTCTCMTNYDCGGNRDEKMWYEPIVSMNE